MKWRITGRFLVSVIFIVVLVIIFNIVIVIALFIAQNYSFDQNLKNEGSSLESFTRNFQEEIRFSAENDMITRKGKRELDKKQAWIQILDENGTQIYGYGTPEAIKEKYTPIDLVNMYKYKEKDVFSTNFVSEVKRSNYRYSYIIGFKSPHINRLVYSYDSREVIDLIQKGSFILLLIDVIVALFIGYLFSKRLTSPLHKLIEGIKRLADRDFNINYERKGIYKDVFHNMNQLSNQLRKTEIEQKKLAQMKEEWISNISHDMKTPLSSILGFAEILKEKEYNFTPEDIQKYAEIIERKSIYMKELIEDLHLSTRLKNKELLLKIEKVNIVSLIRVIVIDVINDGECRDIEFYPSEEKIEVEVDQVLMRRAINNLIDNAIVHNNENVNIKIEVKRGERTHITIKDNGKGVSKSEIDRVFDRHFRGTNTTQSHKGSGLGMAIAKEVIETHEGEITIDSKTGIDSGTNINIVL
ncbi:sensor histidine kinase [Bacillus sp. es.036]|uniref:sensor histidine kinase n=1 Tax=Bacillus sp. es.036 TaxID=1761764 RepID=UPI000BF51070|nr:HAMP domain-containing sensor histidine kinase [Bacillus sp. es.036]PFG14492.1 signal transduction histidine kinase [Bacillus sp. es.036]